MAPRRPLGVTVAALFYIVLGGHALMFGAYLLAVAPEGAPSLPFADLLARDPGIVRGYGATLALIAGAFFLDGWALLRDRWWGRWAVVASAPLHIVGPPFLLGGILFALAANLYLFGSTAARAHFEALAAARAPQP